MTMQLDAIQYRLLSFIHAQGSCTKQQLFEHAYSIGIGSEYAANQLYLRLRDGGHITVETRTVPGGGGRRKPSLCHVSEAMAAHLSQASETIWVGFARKTVAWRIIGAGKTKEAALKHQDAWNGWDIQAFEVGVNNL